MQGKRTDRSIQTQWAIKKAITGKCTFVPIHPSKQTLEINRMLLAAQVSFQQSPKVKPDSVQIQTKQVTTNSMQNKRKLNIMRGKWNGKLGKRDSYRSKLELPTYFSTSMHTLVPSQSPSIWVGNEMWDNFQNPCIIHKSSIPEWCVGPQAEDKLNQTDLLLRNRNPWRTHQPNQARRKRTNQTYSIDIHGTSKNTDGTEWLKYILV